MQLQAWGRRIADLTSPNLPPLGDNPRWGNRYSRCPPAWPAPRENETVAADEATTAVTKGSFDCGLSPVLPFPYDGTDAGVGFWLRSPHLEPELYFLHASGVVPRGAAAAGTWA